METVEHDGRETAYRLVRPDADGPTTLYVHGSAGTHRVWAHQYGPRGPIHPAAALDLSGHGGSRDVGTAPGPDTIEAYVADVCAVAAATGAELLVGASLGGAVVLSALLDGAVEPEAVALVGCPGAFAVPDRLCGPPGARFERALDHLGDLLFHDADASTVRRSLATVRSVGPAIARRDFLTCRRFDVRDRAGEIPVPVLVVVGACDRFTPPDAHATFVSELPDGRLTVIAGAGHLAMLERPGAVNEALGSVQFL